MAAVAAITRTARVINHITPAITPTSSPVASSNVVAGESLISSDQLFLGLDCSTQGFKGAMIDSDMNVISEHAVNFDRDLPEYKTTGGVIKTHGGLVVTAPSRMFIAALDLLLSQFSASQLSRVAAISASGQQHGSVYWSRGARDRLHKLDSKSGSLIHQLTDDIFTVANGPIWMDSSTTSECRRIESAVGSAQRVADITGSRSYERFTGSQISKLYHNQPSVYAATERISLVSSMVPSLLIGDYAPIDASDASGMNLMNLKSRDWSQPLLEATTARGDAATDLRNKLGSLADSNAIVGTIHRYFVQRYAFPANCRIVAGSGDNPCTLAGLRLEQPGDIAISMGTSDTLFAVLETPQPSGQEGHILANPVDPRTYMAMLCYKNGSLTRERVRNASVGASWSAFNKALSERPAGNDGQIGFYFDEPEITPVVNKAGTHRYHNGVAVSSSFTPAAEVKAVVEGQFLSMRLHSHSLGVTSPKRIIATGGGSVNPAILQVIASVFNAPVYTATAGPNTAALGAAYRAAHGLGCSLAARLLPFNSIFPISRGGAGEWVLAARPIAADVTAYDAILPRYKADEAQVLRAVGQ